MPTPMSDAVIAQRLSTLSGWTRAGSTLTRTFQFEYYLAGIAFAAAVGTVCEGIGHHPDMLISWRRVVVSFTTHDAHNVITEADFIAAEAVNRIGYP